ncbi:MAG TPA: indolepyruvate oxidoreductase subunit beta [Dehalococcoidia bacterium]|nr:indolepyruvate oxidoreductase subunit beta [Dehalococcoidia bacterium]
MNKLNLMITGIGGQGVIAASDIVSGAALAAGLDVKKTDSLGMAQRGGSVISHIRFAQKVWSPLVKAGEADILLSFEKLEAARWSHYLKAGGIAIVNNYTVPPPSVSLGKECYPDDTEITGILKQRTDRIYFISGTAFAKELGNVKTLNTLMLGCLSIFVPFEIDIWRDCIFGRLPPKVAKLNFSAFEWGKTEMERILNTRRSA